MMDVHEAQQALAVMLEQAAPEVRALGEAAMVGFLAGLAVKSTPSHE